jgi:hypothetical protein
MLQIERWPFRKLKSIDKLICSVEEQQGQDPVGAEQILQQLRQCKDEIKRNPEVRLCARGPLLPGRSHMCFAG